MKYTLAAHMDRKEEEVPAYVEDKFPANLLLSQIVETWKCAVIAKHDWMINGWIEWERFEIIRITSESYILETKV